MRLRRTRTSRRSSRRWTPAATWIVRPERCRRGSRPARQPKGSTRSRSQPPRPLRRSCPTPPTTRPDTDEVHRFLQRLSRVEKVSDIRAILNARTCVGLSTAGLDKLFLSLCRVRPGLAPAVLTLIEPLIGTGLAAARVLGLLRALSSLGIARRCELVAGLRHEPARREERVGEEGQNVHRPSAPGHALHPRLPWGLTAHLPRRRLQVLVPVLPGRVQEPRHLRHPLGRLPPALEVLRPAIVVARHDLPVPAPREPLQASAALPPFQLAMITSCGKPFHDPSSEPLTR